MTYNKVISVYILGILICSSITCLLFTMGASAAGTTIYVDDSNTAGPWDGTQLYPYQHINDAIAAANDSDTIEVLSGTYTENVVIEKNLTLIGQNKDTTFIDGNGNSRTVYLHGTYINLLRIDISRFTIRNAGGTGNACLACSYVINGDFTDNRIINSLEGDGIQLVNCQSTIISSNVISGNKMAGISVSLSDQNSITNNIMQTNQKGIYLEYSGSNEITVNSIRDNTVYGVYIVRSSNNNVFSRNDFSDNNLNAQDSFTNDWSDNGQGNYWDDYPGYDNNSDGIGDIPYSIPGGANKDYYPLGYFQHAVPPEQNHIPLAYVPTISPMIAHFGDAVTLSGDGTDSDGTIIGYYWRSNLDGFLSTEKSFITTNLSVGSHTIYFKVQDNDGAWSSEQTASVTINTQILTAVIDWITPNPAQQGQSVLFHGHGSGGVGNISAYQWLSNIDGILGTNETIIVSDLTKGTHTIYFQVKDDLDEWSSPAMMTIVIEQNTSSDPSNQLPIADIGGPYQGKINEPVLFNASKSYDVDGIIESYVWTFGDNGSGTGVSLLHTFASPGTYHITVQVIDDDGASAQASTSITITQSSSQGDVPSGSGDTFDVWSSIPFPVILIVMILTMLLIIALFIRWMKKR
jgi:parallel beta-helix repeat protein